MNLPKQIPYLGRHPSVAEVNRYFAFCALGYLYVANKAPTSKFWSRNKTDIRNCRKTGLTPKLWIL